MSSIIRSPTSPDTLISLDVGGVLGTALERLNRDGLVALLEQLTVELDEHCKQVRDGCDEEIKARCAELTAQIDSLRATSDQDQHASAELQGRILELLERVDARVAEITRLETSIRDEIRTVLKTELVATLKSDAPSLLVVALERAGADELRALEAAVQARRRSLSAGRSEPVGRLLAPVALGLLALVMAWCVAGLGAQDQPSSPIDAGAPDAEAAVPLGGDRSTTTASWGAEVCGEGGSTLSRRW